MRYFRDREEGVPHPTEDDISHTVWEGIHAFISRLFDLNYFAKAFPVNCSDGDFVVSTNRHLFYSDMEALVPGSSSSFTNDNVPSTPIAAEIIEFCFDNIAKPAEPKPAEFHEFFRHYHLNFDVDAGQLFFHKRINLLFQRNGIALTLKENGHMERVNAPVIGELVAFCKLQTGDQILDALIQAAQDKYKSSSIDDRIGALEKMYDAWERIKSLMDKDKKRSVEKILVATSSEPCFREQLDTEAKTLTDIGNIFSIRHSETNQIELTESSHIDYLIHRLFSLIYLFHLNIDKSKIFRHTVD